MLGSLLLFKQCKTSPFIALVQLGWVTKSNTLFRRHNKKRVSLHQFFVVESLNRARQIFVNELLFEIFFIKDFFVGFIIDCRLLPSRLNIDAESCMLR